MKNIPLILLIFLFSCGNPQNNFELVYKHSHKAYFEGHNLDYYLQLVGLFELIPNSSNTFGSSPTNDFVITVPGIPANIGSVEIMNDSIVFKSASDIKVETFDQTRVDKKHLALRRGSTEALSYDRLSWFIDKVGDKLYLRVRDLESDRTKSFHGFKYFEPNPAFILKGKVTKWDQPKMIEFPTALNFDQNQNVVGEVTFNYEAKEYKLLIDFNRGNYYSIKFADETSGVETFGAGRYLRFEADEEGVVILDFNFAYNPPCSISEYTTCIFPPKENRLPFKVLAGEMIEKKI